MNKSVLYLLFYFCSVNLNAQQNFVSNGDFELFDLCPTSISTPGDYQIERCQGWYSPTYATSDYYNSCAAWPVSVPTNTYGSRQPQSGNAYCGLLIENCTYPTCSGWWCEYIQSELVQPLEANVAYEFSCYVALSGNYYQYSFSEFGVHFSNNSISLPTPKPFSISPTIQNQRGNYLSDTTNWIEFKTKFVATGGEKYLTIGFFIDTTNIDTLFTDPFLDLNNYSSYYYIDNCKLVETEILVSNIFTPNNDGINDLWKPNNHYERVEILNRWGNLVYELFDGQGWDGKDQNDMNLSDGVYFYKLISDQEIKTGVIQLVR